MYWDFMFFSKYLRIYFFYYFQPLNHHRHLTLAIHHHVGQTLNVGMVYAPASQSTKAIRTQVAVPSVFSIMTAPETKLVSATNVKILAQAPVVRALSVMLLITFQCAVVLQECQEILSSPADLSKVNLQP